MTGIISGGGTMGKMALGTVNSLTVKCLSELSWHDNARMRLDVREAGGLTADQFDVKWTPGNAAGSPAVGKSRPDVKIAIPAGFSARSMELLKSSGHKGEVVEMAPGPNLLFPGCASVTFDQPIFLKTHGAQVLYVYLEGKGIVIITG